MGSRLDDEESVVEKGTDEARRSTQHTLGQARGKATDLAEPKARRRGTHKVTAGAVGFRAAAKGQGDAGKAQQKRLESKKALGETRDARRRAIWDKLDAAKRKADEKSTRLKSFEPAKTNPDDLDDDLDRDLDQDFDKDFDF